MVSHRQDLGQPSLMIHFHLDKIKNMFRGVWTRMKDMNPTIGEPLSSVLCLVLGQGFGPHPFV